jgi:hypothetical protein
MDVADLINTAIELADEYAISVLAAHLVTPEGAASNAAPDTFTPSNVGYYLRVPVEDLKTALKALSYLCQRRALIWKAHDQGFWFWPLVPMDVNEGTILK